MINFVTTQPMHWTPTPAPVVAPVSVVAGVTPTQATSRDSRSGQEPSPRDHGQAPSLPTLRARSASEADAAVPAPSAAPLLPRGSAQADGENSSAGLAEALDKAERKDAEAKAQEKAAQRPPLQDMLTSVWEASAAVVEVALGGDPEQTVAAVSSASEPAGRTALPAPSRTAAAPQRSVSAEVDPAPQMAELRAGQDPVVYTEQGTSSWAPLETGSLISKRV